MLTPEEIAIVEMAGDLFNRFCALEQIHSSDAPEVCTHVHSIQNIVMSRSAQRQHPEKFPKKILGLHVVSDPSVPPGEIRIINDDWKRK